MAGLRLILMVTEEERKFITTNVQKCTEGACGKQMENATM